MSILNHKDLTWFRLANSNPSGEFYKFKDRFLKRFGTPCGFDLQKIELSCHSCDGSGIWRNGYATSELCDRCNGTGIYDTREHWLARYQLGDSIYHKPMDHADVYHLNDAYAYPIPKTIIEGRISHGPVDQKVAQRAFYRLLIRHEPVTFYNVITDRIKSKAYHFRLRLVWKLIKIRNKMDLFRPIEDDSIPF